MSGRKEWVYLSTANLLLFYVLSQKIIDYLWSAKYNSQTKTKLYEPQIEMFIFDGHESVVILFISIITHHFFLTNIQSFFIKLGPWRYCNEHCD